MKKTPVTFLVVVGAALRRWREQLGERQELVALMARRWGLPWSANTVAQVEAGYRHLTVEEWLLIPAILSDLGKIPCSWLDLIPVDGDAVALTPKTTVYAEALRHLVEHQGLLADPNYRALFNTPHDRHFKAWRDLSGSEGQTIQKHVKDSLTVGVVDAVTEVDRKAARKLNTTPRAIVSSSWRQWGHSLMEEREKQLQLAGHELVTPRRAQALRGAITRGLLEELRPLVKRSTPHKKSGKKSTRRKPTRKRQPV